MSISYSRALELRRQCVKDISKAQKQGMRAWATTQTNRLHWLDTLITRLFPSFTPPAAPPGPALGTLDLPPAADAGEQP